MSDVNTKKNIILFLRIEDVNAKKISCFFLFFFFLNSKENVNAKKNVLFFISYWKRKKNKNSIIFRSGLGLQQENDVIT